MTGPSRPILAADADVLARLHGTGLLRAASALPSGMHVIDAVLADIRRGSMGELARRCTEAGCVAVSLSSAGVALASRLAGSSRSGLTSPIALAMVWAEQEAAVLLSDAPVAAQVGGRRGATVRGTSWLTARVLETGCDGAVRRQPPSSPIRGAAFADGAGVVRRGAGR